MPRSRKKRARARAKRAKTGEAELQGIREYLCCSAVLVLWGTPELPKELKEINTRFIHHSRSIWNPPPACAVAEFSLSLSPLYNTSLSPRG